MLNEQHAYLSDAYEYLAELDAEARESVVAEYSSSNTNDEE
jgi:hypothetical protein